MCLAALPLSTYPAALPLKIYTCGGNAATSGNFRKNENAKKKNIKNPTAAPNISKNLNKNTSKKTPKISRTPPK